MPYKNYSEKLEKAKEYNARPEVKQRRRELYKKRSQLVRVQAVRTEAHLESERKYKNSEKGKLTARKYQQKKQPLMTEYFRVYNRTYRQNPLVRIRLNLRNRLRRALRGLRKSASAISDLGCTVDEFKKYFESKFSPGMTWENWGVHGWHIDHIRPLSSFDLSKRSQVLEACHYTNLQPLWAEDNLAKKDRWEEVVNYAVQ